MKICYIDAFSGISGDMTVGALLDAGANPDALLDGLRSLGTGAKFSVEKVKRFGIAGTRFHVDTPQQGKHHHHPPHHEHDHHHDAKDHHHDHHRHLSEILTLIDRSGLPAAVKTSSKRVFERLGVAEAAVHDIPIERVHFHEVGAVDSICDIVGACLGFHLLEVDEVYASSINVGSGTVKCEHGVLPVPAPATATLLKGVPTYSSGPAMELTTPTGAAIVTTLAKSFGPMPPLNSERIGYGAGSRDVQGQPNVLRMMIGTLARAVEAITVSVIEANIDDASPQVLGYAMDRLFEEGALDVTLQPLLMKKNRQGALLRLVARPEDREHLAQLVLAETTTLGLRFYTAERRVLEREHVSVETRFGVVRMKTSPNGCAPEYEDCRRLAHEQKVPLKEILAAATAAWWNQSR